jgi:hypothetical protein
MVSEDNLWVRICLSQKGLETITKSSGEGNEPMICACKQTVVKKDVKPMSCMSVVTGVLGCLSSQARSLTTTAVL